MTQQFDAIKKKYVLSAVLHSVAFGICAGLLVCGITLLCLKMAQIDLAWFWHLAIGFGTALFAFAIMLACIMPSKQRIARLVDNKYSLAERVQTMVEYSNSTSAIAKLQREDTEQKLSSLPKDKVSWQKILLNCILPIVCIVVFIAGVALPKKVDTIIPDTPYVPPTVDIGKIEKNQLENLIENVESSSLPSSLKQQYLDELNSLLANTSEKITEDARKAFGQASLDAIIQMTANHTSFEEAFEALTSQFTILGEAVQAGALYYTSLGVNELVNFNAVNGLASDIEKTADAMILNATNNVLGAMFADIEGETSEDWAKYTLTLTGYCNTLTTALENIPEGNLHSNLTSLLQILQKWAVKQPSDGYTLSAIKAQLILDVKAFNSSASVTLSSEAYVKLIERHVVLMLCNIFGLDVPQQDELKDDSSFTPGTPPNNKTESDDKVYPSENELYDKSSQTYKHYVDVYTNYSGDISKILSDPNVPQELAQIIRTFYENFQQSE